MNFFKKVLFSFFAVCFGTNLYAGTMTDASGNVVYEFIVDNPAMVDAYFNIFNAMASFFSSNDYLEILKIVFLLGGLYVFFGGVLKTYQGGDSKGAISDFAKYMIVGVILLTIIFANSTSLIVKTDNLPSFCAAGGYHNSLITSTPATGTVIGNIPYILGWGFAFINEVGRETTKLAKKGFSSVSGDFTSYTSRSDYGAYLQGVGKVLSADISSLTSNLGSNGGKISIVQGLQAVQRDCLLIPASKDSTFGPDIINAVTNTGNLFETIDTYMTSAEINVYKNPTSIAPEVGYTIPGVNFSGIPPQNLFATVSGGTYTCGQLWTEIKTQLVTLRDSGAIECNSEMKDYFNPQTLQIMTGDSTINTVAQGRNIALNAAMANEMLDQKNNIAAGELSYAAGKSMAEFVHSSMGTGFYMAQMLPYLQMGMRAVLYAFFPFVFIVVLLPGGFKVLISYLQTLIWIELWSPTAAILNMFLSVMSTEKIADMYQSKGFNPTNGLQTFSDSAMLASVGGYLYASVPALTWLILKGSGHMLGNITSAMGSRMAANVDSASINRDKTDMKRANTANKLRQEKGLATMSLAEQDAMAAGYAGLTAGGEWFEKNNAGEDKLLGAARSKTAEDIYSNYGKSKTNLTPDGKAAMEAKGQGQTLKDVEERKNTGEIGPGGVNEDTVKKQAGGEGANSATKRVADKKSGEKIKKDLGVERTADLRSAKEIAGDKGADKTDKLMKALHSKLGYTTDDTFNDMEFNKAVKDVMGNEEFDKFMTETGITSKDLKTGYIKRVEGDNADKDTNVSNLRKTATAAGAFKGAKANAEVYTNQTLGQGNLNEAAKNSLMKGTVENEQVNEVLDKQLNRLAKNGNADAKAALGGTLADKMKVMNMSGKDGQAFLNQFADDKATAVNDINNLTTKQLASMEGADMQTKVLAGNASHKELAETNSGAMALGMARGQLQSDGALLSESTGNADTDKKNHEINNRNVSQRANDLLKAQVESFNTVANTTAIDQKKALGVTAESEGTAQGTQATISTKAMNIMSQNGNEALVTGLVGAEVMGKGAQHLRGAKYLSEMGVTASEMSGYLIEYGKGKGNKDEGLGEFVDRRREEKKIKTKNAANKSVNGKDNKNKKMKNFLRKKR